MASEKSSLKKKISVVELEGTGKNRAEAIGNAFVKLKKASYDTVGDGVVVDLHAVDVFIVEEKEKTTIKKLFGFFMPRKTENYYVKLNVELEIKYL